MTTTIFIDVNVPMYAAGRPHPLKDPALRIAGLARDHPAAFITNAEVVQELVHRYVAVRSWPLGRLVVEDFLGLMHGRIEPMTAMDVEHAAALVDRHPNLAARDLVHLAVMHRVGVTRIASADTDFDRIDGIERLDPADVSTWERTIEA